MCPAKNPLTTEEKNESLGTELRQSHDLTAEDGKHQQQRIQGRGRVTCIIAIQRECAPIARIFYGNFKGGPYLLQS